MSRHRVIDWHTNIVLEDDAVLLRPLDASDFISFEHFALTEPDLWRYSLLAADTSDNMRRYIGLALDGRLAGNEYPFTVVDKRKNRVAGCTRFYDIQEDRRTLQIGYTWYGREFQGTGLNRRCKLLLLDFAFNAGFERVEFRADAENKRSIAAMKSIGCTEEGVLRSHAPKPNGGRRDTVVLSILRNEWLNGTRTALVRRIDDLPPP